MRVNIGCGQTPTQGWRNFDNSLSLRLAEIPLLPALLHNIGILESTQYRFVEFARKNSIEFADASKRLPIPSGSVQALYSCHMLEHLDKNGADRFLEEAFRVLRPAGIIRLAVPDIKKLIDRFCESSDADQFIASTHLCIPRPRSFAQRLRFLLIGPRHHHWMYDGASLTKLLTSHGFINPVVLPAGRSKIVSHEPLDLYERASESVYVEAERSG